MARVTYVKKAQQRYATVPVLNEDGTQKRTPVLRKDGTQKVTKSGRPVFMKVTVADKTRPLPNHKCDKCGNEIKVGDSYKHVTPKSGPYGGRTRYRCATCPTWEIWELSNSLSARIAQIQSEWGSIDLNADSEESDVEEHLTNAAEAIRELAEEKEEAASNIEDGFGHETSMSEDLRQQADDLNSWADDVEGTDVPSKPEEPSDPLGEEPDEVDENDDTSTWEEWDSLRQEWDDYNEAVEEWIGEAETAVSDALDNCPL